jgi:hypothetical protein
VSLHTLALPAQLPLICPTPVTTTLFRPGYGVREFEMHELLAPGISDIPISDVRCNLSSHANSSWILDTRPIRLAPSGYTLVHMTVIPHDRIHTSCRGFGVRRFAMQSFHNHGIPDMPIPDALLSRALAPSGYTMVHVTCYHVTATIPLVGVSGFTMTMCICPLDPRYADPRLPPYSFHLSSTDSWVAHTLYALSGNRVSRFRGSCCQVNWTFQSPDPRFSDEETQRSRSHSCFNGCD